MVCGTLTLLVLPYFQILYHYSALLGFMGLFRLFQMIFLQKSHISLYFRNPPFLIFLTHTPKILYSKILYDLCVLPTCRSKDLNCPTFCLHANAYQSDFWYLYNYCLFSSSMFQCIISINYTNIYDLFYVFAILNVYWSRIELFLVLLLYI